jgi:hypothetical protein
MSNVKPMLQTRICRFIASVIEERYYVIQEEICHGGITIAFVDEYCYYYY